MKPAAPTRTGAKDWNDADIETDIACAEVTEPTEEPKITSTAEGNICKRLPRRRINLALTVVMLSFAFRRIRPNPLRNYSAKVIVR